MTTLREITQRYIREREQAEFKPRFAPNPVLKHLVRNAEAKMSDTIKEVAMDDEPEITDARKLLVIIGDDPFAAMKEFDNLFDTPYTTHPRSALNKIKLSVPHDRTTFDAEYLGQPDGSLRQVPEILVTPEMRMNGGSVIRGGRAGTGRLNPEDDAQAIYRAMHAVAPVPLVSAAEDTIAQLRADRDNALDLAIAETEKYNKACDQIVILRQRLALHGESVTFPADPPPTHTIGDLKPEPKREPKPIPAGALQPTTTDRRRIGG